MTFRHEEQMQPPPPRQVTDVAITRHEHVYEVDPRLMERWVLQQQFPNWDSLRIMNARGDHLAWTHAHFANSVVAGSELLAEVEAEAAVEDAASPAQAASGTEPPATATDR
ncbi:hypothetical protein [Diaminobutyricimonas sp. LJ205]|uniref:hypothetical protein n=1 Tax=Diaminobutyricimonas sp. LJ205 TaxID=2683590 RepID=UPI0018DFB14E|nr:hypothetical protein [Diaminobutyricimonas sp. LJ205]